MTKYLIAGALAAASMMAGEFLPLETGNEWTYRNAQTGQTFQVRVGTPVMADDKMYYSLRGYGDSMLLVRYDDDNQLVAFDEEQRKEFVVASFTPFESGRWQAYGRACDLEGQTLEKRTTHDGPAGAIREALQIEYRINGCADAGVLSEQFAENVGMLRRVVQSIAGPRTYDLVYARVGSTVLEAMPGGRFTVTADSYQNSPTIRVTMRLQTLGSSNMLPLTFPSSQEYEVLLRDPEGKVVWAWSDGRAFTQHLHTLEVAGEWSATVEIPRPPSTGEPRAAVYMVQAWLTTLGQAPQFAATAAVTVTTGLQ